MNETTIRLQKEFFTHDEETLVKHGALEISLFKYKSGVRAARLKNRCGYIVVLPYTGQQIWDAYFYNRSLRMKTNFQNPRDITNFVFGYGAFLMHCGALRMGCPGPKDDHALHGELPCADFSDAELILGEEDNAKYVAISSEYEYNKAFSGYYKARPTITMNENGSILDVDIEIRNMSNYPMELMYMAHINFEPVDFGRIVQCVNWDTNSMRIRKDLPGDLVLSNEYRTLVDKLGDTPELTREMKPQDVYDPEVVYYLHNILADEDGFTHFIQKHPDGSADYVSFNTKQLDHGTRWLVKNKDMRALGIVLPSTCDAEGYNAEKEKGNVRTLEGKATFRASIRTGYLNKDDATKVEEKIRLIVKEG
jgi:hypothetical protein